MTLIDYLNSNWISVVIITFLVLSCGFLYKRFISNSDVFEEFQCIKDPRLLKDCRETIYNNQLLNKNSNSYLVANDNPELTNYNQTKHNNIIQNKNCSNYIIDKSPISNLFRINENCHSSNVSDHAKWSCFYKYFLQKNALENPQNIKGLFKTDYPIFYRV